MPNYSEYDKDDEYYDQNYEYKIYLGIKMNLMALMTLMTLMTMTNVMTLMTQGH